MNRRERLKHVAVVYLIALVAVIVGIAYLKLVKMPVCLIYNLTGMSCASCGVTRMIKAIVDDFDLYQAFRYNPVMFILLPSLAVLFIVQTISYVKHGKFTKYYGKILTAIAVIVVAFGVLRNIPMLYWLLPTEI